MPLAARDFRAIQTAADLYLDSLRAKSQRLLNGFAHRAPKRNSLFQLRCDLFSLQLRVQLGLMNLLNRDQDFTSGARSDVAFELVNLRAFAADDDAGSRRVDDDLQAISGTLDVDVRNARAGETLFQL